MFINFDLTIFMKLENGARDLSTKYKIDEMYFNLLILLYHIKRRFVSHAKR